VNLIDLSIDKQLIGQQLQLVLSIIDRQHDTEQLAID